LLASPCKPLHNAARRLWKVVKSKWLPGTQEFSDVLR